MPAYLGQNIAKILLAYLGGSPPVGRHHLCTDTTSTLTSAVDLLTINLGCVVQFEKWRTVRLPHPNILFSLSRFWKAVAPVTSDAAEKEIKARGSL